MRSAEVCDQLCPSPILGRYAFGALRLVSNAHMGTRFTSDLSNLLLLTAAFGSLRLGDVSHLAVACRAFGQFQNNLSTGEWRLLSWLLAVTEAQDSSTHALINECPSCLPTDALCLPAHAHCVYQSCCQQNMFQLLSVSCYRPCLEAQQVSCQADSEGVC